MELGTISHGTLRDQDLAEAFSDALRTIDRPAYDHIMEEFECTECAETIGSCECEEWNVPEFFVEALVEALEENAPPYAYFGTTEGDGADFGFWPAIDTLMEDIRFEGTPCDQGYDGKHVNGYCCVVSDHGNVSLTDASDHSSIWAIV